MSKLKKVEAGNLRQQPINTQARRVVAPRPWWADPVPEKTVSIDALNGQIQQLKDQLSETRKQSGHYIDRTERKIAALRDEIAEKDRMIRKILDEKRDLLETIESLNKLKVSVNRLLTA